MNEFLVPYSLQDCVLKVSSLSRDTILGISSCYVIIHQASEEVYTFKILRWKYLNHVATLSGELISRDVKTTQIIANATISLKAKIAIFTLFLFSIIRLSFTFLMNNNVNIVFEFISVLIISVMYLLASYWRTELKKSF